MENGEREAIKNNLDLCLEDGYVLKNNRLVTDAMLVNKIECLGLYFII